MRRRSSRLPGHSSLETLEPRRLLAAAIDPTFGGFNGDEPGTVVTDVSGSDFAIAVAVQPDGRLLALSPSNTPVLARYSSSGAFQGSIDLGAHGFGDVSGVAVSGNKFVVAGLGNNSEIRVARFNDDGTPDASFATGGIYQELFRAGTQLSQSVAVDATGGVVLAVMNNFNFAVLRLNSTGQPVVGFQGTGASDGPGYATLNTGNGSGNIDVAIQNDGTIVLAGQTQGSGAGDRDFALVLVEPTADFLTNTGVTYADMQTINFADHVEELFSVAIGANDAIYAAGFDSSLSGAFPVMARFNASGVAIDTTAVPGITYQATGIAVDGSNIWITGAADAPGNSLQFAVTRMIESGAGFTSDSVQTQVGGVVSIPVDVAVQSSGNVIVAGFALGAADEDIALARYAAESTPPPPPPPPPTVTMNVVGSTLHVTGTDQNDTILIDRVDATHRVFVEGNLAGEFSGITYVIMHGGDGHDSLTVNTNATVNTEIYGDNGNDTIVGGGGDDLLFGGNGNDMIRARGKNDVLVGGDGDDVLGGGLGRDILIGGLGIDRLSGDQQEDILIGAYTTHDDNVAALRDIRTEWNSSGSFATRVSRLQNGSGSTGVQLKENVTVFDDGVSDILAGGAGHDWFIGVNDEIVDLHGQEFADVLNFIVGP